ncbi:LacI family DNA-binding transcriptional regulator [Cohaesibacter celericrescens]|uniref:LacI family transcriptional regulator n=1 Tax=Cohaesibacter celericrescens TaxID=2067669 RepID=A0A2N5XN66_9HYPH|nr:LacI family DNA-binding transcriptional regulator [Cohaesibacter celericrescens]PLW75996.1 LacI family transcriptional regulator [Cohaesibacter celericrescens]
MAESNGEKPVSEQSAGQQNRVTADDVANKAGVSRWTVNRAFRPDASISPKSRARVMQAAEQLGYAPDLLASSLASDKSNLVALLVDDFDNPHKLVMLERLTRILRKNGWDTLLVNMIDRDDASHALLNASQRRVDATILIGIEFDDDVIAAALSARRVKKLIVLARSSHNPHTISVCCDDVAAMTEIETYVTQKKYKRPLFFAGPNTASAHLNRKQTFLDLWRTGHGFEPEVIDGHAYDPILSMKEIQAALGDRARQDLPDIIVCENDALAIGAMDAIRHGLGLQVPDDIAVIGFDDVPLALSPNYQLTTYRQPITAMAERIVAILNNTTETDKHDGFVGHIVIRKSA